MSFAAWRRVPEPGACPFCLMLATRGAVYKSDKTAGASNKYHRHCHCRAELETDFDAREDVRIPPDDANQVIRFRNSSNDYAYDLSRYRNLGVTDPPKVPKSAPVRVARPGDIAKRAKVGRDVKVVRDRDLPTVDPAYIAKLRRLEDAAAQSDDMAKRHAKAIAETRKAIADMEATRARAIASRPRFNPDNPLEFYGDTLQIVGDSAKVRESLEDLEVLPQRWHEMLRDHFLTTKSGGTYVGDVTGMPQLDDLGVYAGVHPRAWPEGATWDTVGGCYEPGRRVVAVATRGGSGSISTALHETSHALDGLGVRDYDFDRLWAKVAKPDTSGSVPKELAKPYFSQSGNPTGWISEGWAESLAAYLKAGRTGESASAAISRKTGIPVESADEVASYFDSLLSQGSQAA